MEFAELLQGVCTPTRAIDRFDLDPVRVNGYRIRGLARRDRFVVTLGDDWIGVNQREGYEGESPYYVILSYTDPERIQMVFNVWQQDRSTWAEFQSVRDGYPSGLIRDHYIPPEGGGPFTERVVVRNTKGPQKHGRSNAFVGKDEFRQFETSRAHPSGLEVMGEHWRVGECHGPQNGSLIGLRFRIRPGLVVDTKRLQLEIIQEGGGSIILTEDELEQGEFPSWLEGTAREFKAQS